MDDYVAKPVSRNAIQMMLGRWYGNAGDPISVDKVERNEVPSAQGNHKLCEDTLGELRHLEDDGNEGLVRRVMSRFLDSSPDLLDRLSSGCEHRNADRLQKASHALKSASAIIGAVLLASYCARLEIKARGGFLDEAIALASDVMMEYQNIRPSVEAAVLGTAA
jgi:HPt (histidine-containing phosphotransfer) domain-containing protein